MRITECIVIVDVDGVAGNYRLMEIMKMMMMTTATIMMIKRMGTMAIMMNLNEAPAHIKPK